MLNIKTIIYILLISIFLFNNTLTAKSLDPIRKNSFSFVVMGDNRPQGRKTSDTQPKVFYNIIDEVNLLDPEFSVILGDLIFGYSKNTHVLGRMWNEFNKAAKNFNAPYYLVIGNHDVSNQEMEKQYIAHYEKEFPKYYSFNHKNSHFIVLDCEEPGAEEQIIGKQLEWLKKDLKRNKKAKHIFVFLHRPLQEEVDPTNWMTTIHPLLAKYNVDTVFAGHWHVYQKSATRDGIRYIITGGAGAPIGNSTINGSFFHYLLVTVRDNKTSIAVIKPGNIKNEEIVNQKIVDNTEKMIDELTTIYLPKNTKKLPATLNLIITNRFDTPVTGKVFFTKNKKTPWTIPSNTIISIESGKTQTIELGITKPITTKTLDELKPIPRVFWHLNVGELTFNVASNKRIRLIVDTWPHNKDVTLLKNKSISIKPIRVQNNMSGNITVTATNPISELPITIKTKWVLPKNTKWRLPAKRSKTYNLKPGKELTAKTPFSFEGTRTQLFPLPHLEIKTFIENELAWQEAKRLSIISTDIFKNKTITNVIKRITSTPTIDGVLSDLQWKKCNIITDFILEQANGKAYSQTEARLAYDNKKLYFAIRCNDNDMDNLKLNTIKNDGGVFNDDSIELFIDSNHDKKTYFQYVINAKGLIFDSHNQDKSWDGPITSKVGREKNAWTLELAIPWKTLELSMPNKGTLIGFNISRNKMHDPIEHSQWSPTFGNNHTPQLFGTLKFN